MLCADFKDNSLAISINKLFNSSENLGGKCWFDSVSSHFGAVSAKTQRCAAGKPANSRENHVSSTRSREREQLLDSGSHDNVSGNVVSGKEYVSRKIYCMNSKKEKGNMGTGARFARKFPCLSLRKKYGGIYENVCFVCELDLGVISTLGWIGLERANLVFLDEIDKMEVRVKEQGLVSGQIQIQKDTPPCPSVRREQLTVDL
ncbi:hypothetical protein AVEN_136962-1 [Araneus ventricosus]|uniref:Uncharacterized protein n=1 Tax=Araneus ventricosus TaxID=182803 RepID=A0A4Y2BGX8_ARAVE|nr:hypothetical protein AVEN_136962-1 [Araneus ventricosus]